MRLRDLAGVMGGHGLGTEMSILPLIFDKRMVHLSFQLPVLITYYSHSRHQIQCGFIREAKYCCWVTPLIAESYRIKWLTA
jgi:hypothetical protein